MNIMTAKLFYVVSKLICHEYVHISLCNMLRFGSINKTHTFKELHDFRLWSDSLRK